jgi:hypothetical protein
MHTIDQKIRDMDIVSFRRQIEEWPVGTIGMVIDIEGDIALVEIDNDCEKLWGLVNVRLADLKFVEKYPFEKIFKDYLTPSELAESTPGTLSLSL